MEFEVTFLTIRGSAVTRRSRRVDVQRLRFGRGTGNEVQLPDIRVDLTAAALFPRSGVLTIEAVGPSPLRVNGRGTRSAAIGLGDEVLIGPYRIQVSEPPPGCDVALVIELVQPLGDAFARLMLQVRTGSEGAPFGKRAVAWLGSLLVAVICLVAPIVIYAAGMMPLWRPAESDPLAAPIAFLARPGEPSNAHRFFAANCETCHRKAFQRVPDDACLSCHGGVAGHIEPRAENAALSAEIANMRCRDCHREHAGRRGMTINDDRFCRDCHGRTDPSLVTANRTVAGFPAGHPQFRATLVTNAAGPQLGRFELGTNPPALDQPGLKFSHAAHVGPEAKKLMICADCHRPAGGTGFLPINYQQHCENCHQLDFDRHDLPWPDGKVPHHRNLNIAAAIADFYDAVRRSQSELAGPWVERRPPGSPSAPGGVSDTSWAAKIATAIADFYDAVRRSRSELAGPWVERHPPGLPSTPGGVPDTSWVAKQTEAALRAIVRDEEPGCLFCHSGRGSGWEA